MNATANVIGVVTNSDGSITVNLSVTVTQGTPPPPPPPPPPSSDVLHDATPMPINTDTKILISPAHRRYFKFAIGSGLRYFRVNFASYDQKAIINMIVQSGVNEKDYFDTMHDWYVANTAWGRVHIETIGGTKVWANMNNNPYGQAVTVYSPAAGDYYIVAVNEDGQLTASDVITVQAY